MTFLVQGFFRAVLFLLNTYMILLVIVAVLRMARADESSPLMRAVSVLTDPPANWLRRKFPRLVIRTESGYADLSPFVLLLLAGVVQIFVDSLGNWLLRLISG
jgi:uncharacterized protein YggT (Ycf19 family)